VILWIYASKAKTSHIKFANLSPKMSKSTIFEMFPVDFAQFLFLLLLNGLKIEKYVSFEEREVASRLWNYQPSTFFKVAFNKTVSQRLKEAKIECYFQSIKSKNSLNIKNWPFKPYFSDYGNKNQTLKGYNNQSLMHKKDSYISIPL